VQCWHPFAATHSTQAADTSEQHPELVLCIKPVDQYCSTITEVLGPCSVKSRPHRHGAACLRQTHVLCSLKQSHLLEANHRAVLVLCIRIQ
jgi:hypothetical protein